MEGTKKNDFLEFLRSHHCLNPKYMSDPNKQWSWKQNPSLPTPSSFHHLEYYFPHFLTSLQHSMIMENNWSSKIRTHRKPQLQGRKWISIGRQLGKWFCKIFSRGQMFGTKQIPSNSVYAPKDCNFGRVVNIQPQCPNRTNIWIVSAKPRLQTATISSEVKIISNKFIHFQLSNT